MTRKWKSTSRTYIPCDICGTGSHYEACPEYLEADIDEIILTVLCIVNADRNE